MRSVKNRRRWRTLGLGVLPPLRRWRCYGLYRFPRGFPKRRHSKKEFRGEMLKSSHSPLHNFCEKEATTSNKIVLPSRETPFHDLGLCKMCSADAGAVSKSWPPWLFLTGATINLVERVVVKRIIGIINIIINNNKHDTIPRLYWYQ